MLSAFGHKGLSLTLLALTILKSYHPCGMKGFEMSVWVWPREGFNLTQWTVKLKQYYLGERSSTTGPFGCGQGKPVSHPVTHPSALFCITHQLIFASGWYPAGGAAAHQGREYLRCYCRSCTTQFRKRGAGVKGWQQKREEKKCKETEIKKKWLMRCYKLFLIG